MQLFQDWSDMALLSGQSYNMHELLCFVCAEDEIFDSAGDHKKEHSRYRAVM